MGRSATKQTKSHLSVSPVGPSGNWEATYVCYVVPRQQDLRDGLLQVLEDAVPYAHEAALADGGEGLQLGEVFGAFLLVHAAQADADGARGDDDDAVAIFAELVGGFCYEGEVGQQWLVCLLVHDGTCSCVGEDLLGCLSVCLSVCGQR